MTGSEFFDIGVLHDVRVGEDVRGRAVGGEESAFEDEDSWAEFGGEGEVVGGDEEGMWECL